MTSRRDSPTSGSLLSESQKTERYGSLVVEIIGDPIECL